MCRIRSLALPTTEPMDEIGGSWAGGDDVLWERWWSDDTEGSLLWERVEALTGRGVRGVMRDA